jgi:hypothetical protein
MPYITPTRRDMIRRQVRELLEEVENLQSGDITYLFTEILLQWLGDSAKYDDYAQAVGILETAKLELYRRKIAPYEDIKKEENGDIEGFTQA